MKGVVSALFIEEENDDDDDGDLSRMMIMENDGHMQ